MGDRGCPYPNLVADELLQELSAAVASQQICFLVDEVYCQLIMKHEAVINGESICDLRAQGLGSDTPAAGSQGTRGAVERLLCANGRSNYNSPQPTRLWSRVLSPSGRAHCASYRTDSIYIPQRI
jgi:hypothetical protein